MFAVQTILLASAAVQPEELFVYTEENRRMVEEEIFAFERACSRLREMQSIEYLERVFPDDGDNEEDEATGVDDGRGGVQRQQ